MGKFLEVLPLIIALVEKLLGPKTGPRKLGLATIIARDSLLYLAHDGSVSQSDAHDIGQITRLIQANVGDYTQPLVEQTKTNWGKIVESELASREAKSSIAEMIAKAKAESK